MKTHEIKLNYEFCDDVLSGDKSFEIRLNDRGYQKGDHIRFTAFNDGLYPSHLINKKVYEITYVLNGFGLKNGYVAFGIRELKEV